MSSRVQPASLPTFATYSKTSTTIAIESYQSIFEENRHRIYSLAFWMTDNEMSAEEISSRVFCRAFSGHVLPTGEQIEAHLISELRDLMPIGVLSLQITSTSTEAVRGNVKRIHLERAVVQIPSTERLAFLMHDVEGHSHEHISRVIGLTVDESKEAVHQARLLVRELIAEMR
jgi:RNA polymerase sigma-70 factor, ECF subfamily